ncbi:WD40 repeat domain-containing protein [Nocardia seriolae]|uniref:WD40 repeat domain-containing protein n=1 Tax=Nocardia seriolae TaxID=37332 RepID=A0ABC9Z2K1_9NOCA|nr:WD40 repeat domain-containing protein [Nocardia seriolae]BEK95029.1 hypothetical protein NSER024013_29350 [Nocardia seriolae]GAM49966.1 hypothetical protein NS07_v2contig00130-0020 [Nocardia seriolae]GAP31979.1 hypothetical protein NSK11_contig00135-0020 [Nocardia seriolae]
MATTLAGGDQLDPGAGQRSGLPVSGVARLRGGTARAVFGRTRAAAELAAMVESATGTVESATGMVLALFGVGLLVLGIGLYAQIRLSDQRRADSEFAAVLAAADQVQHSDPSLAAQLNLVAWRLRPGDPIARSRLLQSQATPLLSVTPAHPDAVAQIAYQPAARMLASLDMAGSLRLWDTTDPKHPRALEQRLTDISEMAIDASARTMATSPAPIVSGNTQLPPNRVVTLWDISGSPAPRQVAQLPTDAGQIDLALSPDGRTLATMTWDRLTLWDVSNPAAPVWRADRPLRGSVHSGALRFSPDGRMLARIDRDSQTHLDTVELWNVADPNAPAPLAPGFATTAESTGGGINAFAFSPNSALLAVGIAPESGSHAIVQLWDLADPAHPRLTSSRQIDHGTLTALDFEPKGHSVAAATGKTVSVWNVTDPRDPTLLVDGLSASLAPCRTAVRHTSLGDDRYQCCPSPRTLAFTADGHALIAGASNGDLHTWSLPPAFTPTRPGSQQPSPFVANGTEVAIRSVGPRATTLWDVRNPQAPRMITEYPTDSGAETSVLSPDGATLLEFDSSKGVMSAVDVSGPVARVRGTWTFPNPTSLRGWSVSADFHTLETVDEHQLMQLWDLADLPRATPLGNPIQAPKSSSFGFGGDGKTMIEIEFTDATDHPEMVTTLWSIADRAHPTQVAELSRRPSPEVSIVAFTPDMRTMVVSGNGAIQPWDISAPRTPRRLGQPIAAKISGLAGTGFTTDSRTMIARGFDGVLLLWDFSDRAHATELATRAPTAGYSDASSLAIGRDLLATVTTEGTFALWDLDAGHAVDRICSVTGVFWTEDLWHRYLPQLPYHAPCDR